LDDPFTSFDPFRLQEAMQVCKGIAKEYQIILFTCTNLYDIYADNIIELGYALHPNPLPDPVWEREG
jgi:uncharacterized protein YhaN